MGGPPVSLEFVHRFIPARERGTGLTLLMLHGTGGDETDLLPLGETLAPGAALVSPRGKVRENGMPRFFRRLREGVFDQEDLRFRTQELADFVGAAAASYGFDPAGVVAVGFSNGANIAASVLLLRPQTFAGAVLFRPMVPLIPEVPPQLAGVPIFVGAGRSDSIVAPADTERLVSLLRGAGADVTVQWVAGGHALTGDDIEAARGWVREFVARRTPVGRPGAGAAPAT